MRHLLLSLLLLLSLSSEALADRGRLNRFGTLTVTTINSLPSAGSDITINAVDDVIIQGGGANIGIFDVSGGGLFMQGSNKIYNTAGTAAAPSYSFQGASSNTGFSAATADQIAVSADGITVATFDSGGLAMISGTAAAPSFTFSGDGDTGVYRIGANSLGFTTGGSFRAQVTSVGVATTGEFRNITTGGGIVLRSPDGTYSVCTVDNSDVLSCTAE